MNRIAILITLLCLTACIEIQPEKSGKNLSSATSTADSQRRMSDSAIVNAGSLITPLDTFTKRYATFTMNELQCHWTLSLAIYQGLKAGQGVLELIDDESGQTILIDTNYYDLERYHSGDFNGKNATTFRDINFDGLKDCVLYDRIGSGSGGDIYNVYLFNIQKRLFEKSELSGANLRVDSLKRTVTTSWRMGAGWNQSVVQHINKHGKIAFTETFLEEHIAEDSIKTIYEKLVNGKVVRSKTDTIRDPSSY